MVTSAGAVRIGVIGTGFGARTVAPVFDATDGCEVVDVVSPRDDEAVRGLCARKDVDLISVHSPPFMHLGHVRAAIEGGHAVLVDKPMGRNAAEASEMLELASAAGVVHLGNFQMRWHPARERLHELVRDGLVGTVDHLQWNVFVSSGRGPRMPYGWLFDRALGGGLIGASGSHAIDFVLWTLGAAARVCGEARTVVTERPDRDGQVHECTADDTYTALLGMQSGATVTIDSTLVAPANLPQVITVIGSEGILEATNDEQITLRTADGERDEFVLEPDGEPGFVIAMQRFARVVRDAVRAGGVEDGTPTFVDAVACARVMDQIRG